MNGKKKNSGKLWEQLVKAMLQNGLRRGCSSFLKTGMISNTSVIQMATSEKDSGVTVCNNRAVRYKTVINCLLWKGPKPVQHYGRSSLLAEAYLVLHAAVYHLNVKIQLFSVKGLGWEIIHQLKFVGQIPQSSTVGSQTCSPAKRGLH